MQGSIPNKKIIYRISQILEIKTIPYMCIFLQNCNITTLKCLHKHPTISYKETWKTLSCCNLLGF